MLHSCLQAMVDIVKHGLNDENQKVKTITALTVSALAEAASPYGIESFDDVLEPLWKGIRLLRGKVSSVPLLRISPTNYSLPDYACAGMRIQAASLAVKSAWAELQGSKSAALHLSACCDAGNLGK